ncbi:hypothetical protein [Streptomyces hydrogenans]|uniref:hypothetical protein n=1 Tax=Streptomyces hydrogenans TaxID=1873719 RepID=UPI00344A168E
MQNVGALRGALQDWLEDLRNQPPAAWAARELARRASWDVVVAEVKGLTSFEARPDLFDEDGISPRVAVLIGLSGLGQVAEAYASGIHVPVDGLAADFAAFCMNPAPVSQVWILLDVDLPSDTHVPLGEYTVRTMNARQLAELSPLPSARGFVRPCELDPELLAGAAFLCKAQPDVPLVRGGGLRIPGLDRRPERKHVDPLLTLQLWKPDEGIGTEAYFRVEPGRYSEKVSGSVYTEPQFDAFGEEAGECHRTWGYRVLSSKADSFAGFCSSVHGMIEAVRSGTTKKGKTAPSAVALGSAANRLVRASQRTMSGMYVDEAEADDVVLDYVVALEALLAQGPGDLRRRTSQRGAALWPDDEDRLAVYRIIKAAYGRRSKYAHGDEQEPITAEELLQIRLTAFAVFLRWLVVTSAFGEDTPMLLDDSLLSAEKRHQVAATLDSFFLTSPPAGPSEPRYW